MTAVQCKRLVFLCILFFIFSSFTLCGFDLYVNNGLKNSCQPEELKQNAYPVNTGGRYRAGISLLEALPLFIDVYKMEITTPAGTHILEGDNLADRFGQWMLLIDPGSIHLRMDDATYHGLTELRIYGELLESKDLTLWISWEGLPELKAELRRFEELHGLEFQILQVPSIDSKLTAAVRSRGAVPDVVMVQSDFLPALTESEALQRLDYMYLPDMLDKGKQAFFRDGSLWAIPFYFDTQLLFYNPDLVDRAGPDIHPAAGWNLSDFEILCRKLKTAGVSPATWNAYSAYWLVPFQMGFGKKGVLETDGTVIIDDRPTLQALEYIISLEEKGFLDIRERDGMIGRFISGNVGMILSGSYSIPEFEKLGIPFQIAPYPFNEGTGRNITPLLDFKALGITRKTKRPVLARRLIEYLSGTGVQQRFPTAVSKLPANGAAWEIMKIKNSHYSVLEYSYGIGTVIPPEDSYKIYKNTMWKLLRFALTGELSVEETLRQGQQIINTKLEQRSR